MQFRIGIPIRSSCHDIERADHGEAATPQSVLLSAAMLERLPGRRGSNRHGGGAAAHSAHDAVAFRLALLQRLCRGGDQVESNRPSAARETVMRSGKNLFDLGVGEELPAQGWQRRAAGAGAQRRPRLPW